MRKNSTPTKLNCGDWHLPYLVVLSHKGKVYGYGVQIGDTEEVQELSVEDARNFSAAACAQVSYRTLDLSPEKVKRIVEKLSDRFDPHLSPFEHQAAVPYFPKETFWEKGITHRDRQGNSWSGNFRGYIQNRQLMEKQ